jgi:hypothetical protein
MTVVNHKLEQSAKDHLSKSNSYVKGRQFMYLLSPFRVIETFFDLWYILLQRIIVALFKPVSYSVYSQNSRSSSNLGTAQDFRPVCKTSWKDSRYHIVHYCCVAKLMECCSDRSRIDWRVFRSVCFVLWFHRTGGADFVLGTQSRMVLRL